MAAPGHHAQFLTNSAWDRIDIRPDYVMTNMRDVLPVSLRTRLRVAVFPSGPVGLDMPCSCRV